MRLYEIRKDVLLFFITHLESHHDYKALTKCSCKMDWNFKKTVSSLLEPSAFTSVLLWRLPAKSTNNPAMITSILVF